MLTGRNIVCIASNWDAHPTSKHHVMRRLAEHNDVIWVNFHASRRPSLGSASDRGAIFRRLRQACAGAKQVLPRLRVLSPLVLPVPESPLARAFNAQLLARQIRAALRSLPKRPVQLWLFTPDVPELIPRLSFERIVYYCVDDFPAFAGFNAGLITKLEEKTIAASDLVLATSAPLLEKCRRLHADTRFLPHGVDVAHFARAATLGEHEIPADVRDLPSPVFGYFGLISDYVDLELIATVARRRRDWQFVLLGNSSVPLDAAMNIPNVRLLGGKSYESLPSYCRKFSVGIIPFRMNRLVTAVNPIKLREYLAAGLPVLSAPMCEVERYAPAVQTAETPVEFEAAAERILAAGRSVESDAARTALVQEESWASRVEQISAWLETLPQPA